MIVSKSLSRRDWLLAARGLGLVAALSTVAGCAVLGGVNTPTPLYDLKPQVDLPAGLPKVKWQLVVSQPDADADLDTARIALRRGGNVTEYFANAAWTDNVPNLVQSKLLEAFEQSNCVAVGRDVASLIPDYVLQIELRDFQAEYGGPVAGAHVRMTAKIVRMSDRRIIDTINAEARAQSSGTDMQQVVAAFDKALGPVLSQIVAGTLKAIPAS
ncbi:MAG TPA: ABC-type transport auxiliary lipoprotein family protein [Terriglobia bacterium]|nr:ABC-type transport auxiliary lipoprotein family protein [Terriglobia bacterium]